MINHFQYQLNCGQISFLADFFSDFQDDVIKTTLVSATRIQALISVDTALTSEEAERHIKQVFAKSKYGPGLYYTVHYVPA